MKRSAAFIAAERARRRHVAVSPSQRDWLIRLARKQGIETPRVRSSAVATKAITALEKRTKPFQPELEGFGAVGA